MLFMAGPPNRLSANSRRLQPPEEPAELATPRGQGEQSRSRHLFDYDDYDQCANWHDSLKIRRRRQRQTNQQQLLALLNRQSLPDLEKLVVSPDKKLSDQLASSKPGYHGTVSDSHSLDRDGQQRSPSLHEYYGKWPSQSYGQFLAGPRNQLSRGDTEEPGCDQAGSLERQTSRLHALTERRVEVRRCVIGPSVAYSVVSLPGQPRHTLVSPASLVALSS